MLPPPTDPTSPAKIYRVDFKLWLHCWKIYPFISCFFVLGSFLKPTLKPLIHAKRQQQIGVPENGLICNV